MLAHLRRVVAAIEIAQYPTGVIGRRDACLLPFGFAGAFRRSELSGLKTSGVSLLAEDGLHIHLGKAKTDQAGRRLNEGTPLRCCPAHLPGVRLPALDTNRRGCVPARQVVGDETAAPDPARGTCLPRQQHARHDSPEPAVVPSNSEGGAVTGQPISGQAVNHVVKDRLQAAGIPAGDYGSHSLRAGSVTEAFRAHATPHEIMNQTGHRTPATVETYARENNPLDQNAVMDLGL